MSVLYYILVFVLAVVLSVFALRRVLREDLVGNLLLVEQDGEETAYMLEIFKGKADLIKEGEYVLLHVKREKL